MTPDLPGYAQLTPPPEPDYEQEERPVDEDKRAEVEERDTLMRGDGKSPSTVPLTDLMTHGGLGRAGRVQTQSTKTDGVAPCHLSLESGHHGALAEDLAIDDGINEHRYKAGEIRGMTKDEAIAIYDSGAWKDLSVRDRALAQMEAPLFMPFDEFHRAVEETLGRPVYTHEFGLNHEGILAELRGEGTAPSLKEIIEMIPKEKRVVLITPNPTNTLRPERRRG